MVEPDGLSAFLVDNRIDRVAHIELALFHCPVVDDRIAAFLRVDNLEELAGLREDSGVADLTATFGIERRR